MAYGHRNPVKALREQAAEGARRIDLTSEEGHAAAQRTVSILGSLDNLVARRKEKSASIALLWVAVGAIAILALLCVGAILWILFRSNSPPAAQIASIPTVVTAFATFAWAILKRADAERAPQEDGEEPAEEPADATPLGLLARLRGRT